MKTREQLTADIIQYFKDNEETFYSCIEELDAYNGYLGDDRYYEMYMLNEFYSNCSPLEVLERAYYGRDADSWTTDARGDRTYGEFNPNRDYFRYNGYGNLVSTDYPDYSDHLDEYLIDALQENRDYIDTIDDNDDLRALFDALEDIEQ